MPPPLSSSSTPPSESTGPPTPTNLAQPRILLTQLESLRDSLSLRVDQLSSAVERLRLQAGELERSLADDTLFPNQIPVNVTDRPHSRSATRRSPPITPAPRLLREETPNGTDETPYILDRAAEPPVYIPLRPSQPEPQVVARLVRARQPGMSVLDVHAVAPNAARAGYFPMPDRYTDMAEWERLYGLRFEWTNGNGPARGDGPHVGLYYAPVNLELQGDDSGGVEWPFLLDRQGNVSSHRTRRTTANHAESYPSVVRRTDVNEVRSEPARQGLPPTNSAHRQGREPLVVRTIPDSPATTITPDSVLPPIEGVAVDELDGRLAREGSEEAQTTIPDGETSAPQPGSAEYLRQAMLEARRMGVLSTMRRAESEQLFTELRARQAAERRADRAAERNQRVTTRALRVEARMGAAQTPSATSSGANPSWMSDLYESPTLRDAVGRDVGSLGVFTANDSRTDAVPFILDAMRILDHLEESARRERISRGLARDLANVGSRSPTAGRVNIATNGSVVAQPPTTRRAGRGSREAPRAHHAPSLEGLLNMSEADSEPQLSASIQQDDSAPSPSRNMPFPSSLRPEGGRSPMTDALRSSVLPPPSADDVIIIDSTLFNRPALSSVRPAASGNASGASPQETPAIPGPQRPGSSRTQAGRNAIDRATSTRSRNNNSFTDEHERDVFIRTVRVEARMLAIARAAESGTTSTAAESGVHVDATISQSLDTPEERARFIESIRRETRRIMARTRASATRTVGDGQAPSPRAAGRPESARNPDFTMDLADILDRRREARANSQSASATEGGRERTPAMATRESGSNEEPESAGQEARDEDKDIVRTNGLVDESRGLNLHLWPVPPAGLNHGTRAYVSMQDLE